MEKYRDAAVLAVDLIANGSAMDPASAWLQSTRKCFPTSKNLQEKGCPRGAFLGLCSAGFVKGIEPARYGRASKNGKYAVDAVEVLRSNKFLASQPNMLWKKVAGNTVSENGQMDVVIGLWEAELISKE